MIKKIYNEYKPRLEEILDKTEASRALAAGKLYLKMLEDQRKEAEHQLDIFTDNRALADLAYNVEQNALGIIVDNSQ